MASQGSVLNCLGHNPFPFKTIKCSQDSKKLDSGKRKKGTPTKQIVILFLRTCNRNIKLHRAEFQFIFFYRSSLSGDSTTIFHRPATSLVATGDLATAKFQPCLNKVPPSFLVSPTLLPVAHAIGTMQSSILNLLNRLNILV